MRQMQICGITAALLGRRIASVHLCSAYGRTAQASSNVILMTKSATRTIRGRHALVNSVCQPASSRHHDFAIGIRRAEEPIAQHDAYVNLLAPLAINSGSPRQTSGDV